MEHIKYTEIGFKNPAAVAFKRISWTKCNIAGAVTGLQLLPTKVI